MSTTIEFNPFLPAFQQDTVAAFRELREKDPVHQCPALNGWVITRYQDTETILTDRTRFDKIGVGAKRSENATRAEIEDVFRNSLADPDPKAHARQRKLLAKAFTPRALDLLRPLAQRLVDDAIDAALRRGELDVAREVGRVLSMTIICKMLGVPHADEESFSTWVAAFLQFVANPMMSDEQFAPLASGIQPLIDYTRRLVEDHRARLGDDLLSSMIAAEEQGETLSSEEVLANAIMMIAAGTETSQNAISYGILALLDHPEELARLQSDPSLLPQAVEELLRHSSMGVLGTAITLTEAELGGKRIGPGQILFWSSTAANRDPSAFSDPDRLDLLRKDMRHLSFGVGPHFCIGAALARMEMQVAIGTIVRSLPGMRLKGSRSDVKFEFNMLLRAIPSLTITW
jgi:pimeloyl-[acyl-carrier protein] synthase